MRFKKRLRYLVGGILTLFAGTLFLFYQNNHLVVSHYVFSLEKQENKQTITLVHLSDLHGKSFGVKQKRLIDKVKEQNPDMILMTGDMVDRRRYDERPLFDLIEGLFHVAPIAYVSGNHENWSGQWPELKKALEGIGVMVLDDNIMPLEVDGKTLVIAGLADPIAPNENTLTTALRTHEEAMHAADFSVLLAHRPEWFLVYAKSQPDLILSGHAHGGQIRVPFMGGIMAPGQGFLPAFSEGFHSHVDNGHVARMIVSRGLGNSIFPFRVFNEPEIVVITIEN